MDVDRRGDEVERESFLRSSGERDLDSCFFSAAGDSAASWAAAGGEGLSSLSDRSEQTDLAGLAARSSEAGLKASCSLGRGATSSFSWSLSGGSSGCCGFSVEFSGWGLGSTREGTGLQAPAGHKMQNNAFGYSEKRSTPEISVKVWIDMFEVSSISHYQETDTSQHPYLFSRQKTSSLLQNFKKLFFFFPLL